MIREIQRKHEREIIETAKRDKGKLISDTLRELSAKKEIFKEVIFFYENESKKTWELAGVGNKNTRRKEHDIRREKNHRKYIEVIKKLLLKLSETVLTEWKEIKQQQRTE